MVVIISVIIVDEDVDGEIEVEVVAVAAAQRVVGLAVTQLQSAFAEFKTSIAVARPQPPVTQSNAKPWMLAKFPHRHS